MERPHESQPQIVALGELLVDFIQVETGDDGRARFARAAGGAPANVAAAATALGVPAAFVGKVGDDPLGHFALGELAVTGVDVSGVVLDPTCCTTLAFAQEERPGELSYSFVRKPGADLQLTADEVEGRASIICNARVLHVGSLSLVAEPARSATEHAARMARDAGVLVSYDPNVRPFAWDDAGEMLNRVRGFIGRADLLKVNEDEMRLLCGSTDPAEGASALLTMGPSLVAVTCGDKGALLATEGMAVHAPAHPVSNVADTAGAGDTFWGAVLSWLVRRAETRADLLGGLTAADLEACARFACAAASACVERRGALGSAPTLHEVLGRL